MQFNVSENLLKMYKQTGKNPNLMIDYILGVIDSRNCQLYFKSFDKMPFDDNKVAFEISKSNVKFIENLFNDINDNIVEKILWISLLFQEV